MILYSGTDDCALRSDGPRQTKRLLLNHTPPLRLAALTKQANDAYNDRVTAAKTCASALHKAPGDGIHNKSWWDHVAEDLSEWGGKIAEIANDLAPFLDVLALATSWIPGVDVITAALAEADNIIALVGTGMQIAGDAMQGHWGDALMGAGMLGLTFLGGKAIEKVGGKLMLPPACTSSATTARGCITGCRRATARCFPAAAPTGRSPTSATTSCGS